MALLATWATVTQTHQNYSMSTEVHTASIHLRKRRERRVDLQRRAQVPHACSTDVVAIKAAMCKCEYLPRSWGSLWLCHRNCKTPTPPKMASTSTSRPPHPSFVSVKLTRSAAPRSRTPSSPMLLLEKLSICKFEHWPRSWGALSATATAAHPHRLIPHPHQHPNLTSASLASC
jgi:hypothetical protein